MYDFNENNRYRAQALRVVDGDTVDLWVDLGFRNYLSGRFRLYGIDTPELNSKDEALRAKALEAKQFSTGFCASQGNVVLTNDWLLEVNVKKDPDNFGRWLVSIFKKNIDGTEVCLNEELLKAGLASIYVR